MKCALLILLLSCSALWAQMPHLQTLRVSWDAYAVPAGVSNVVVVIYKSTSLGTVFTPFKPTAYAPASRTNTTISVLPGTYHFYATAQGSLPESPPSNLSTNIVSP